MRGKPLTLPPELPERSLGVRHEGKLVLPTPEVTEWFQLRLNITPVPKARPRARAKQVGKGRWAGEIYTPATSAVYECQIRLLALLSNIWHVPTGSVGLTEWFSFERPKYLMKAKYPDGPMWRPKSPDSDNLEKAVWDALNGIAWKDDAQVVFHQCYDMYSAKGEGSYIDLCYFVLEGEKQEYPNRVVKIEETIEDFYVRKRQIEREEKKKNETKKTHGF